MGKKIKDVHRDRKKTRRQKKRMRNGKRKQRQKVRIDTRTFLRVGQRLNEEQTSTRRDTEGDREKSFLSFTSFTSPQTVSKSRAIVFVGMRLTNRLSPIFVIAGLHAEFRE